MTETVKRDKKDDEHLPRLPQEVILENILTRLPVKTLIIFGSVCKLWYNSFHNDPCFASSHFLQSQNNPHLTFSVFNTKVRDNTLFFDNYFFFISEDCVKVDHSILRKNSKKEELVGYCNGLVCLLSEMYHQSVINIFHPSRQENLFIIPPNSLEDVLCYGFGFDLISNDYKVVIIFFEYPEFKCKVFTLGTNSWREITCHPSTNQILKKKRSTHSKLNAIFCDGALFWRTTRQPKHDLLSFHLHDETFQVIQLPTECVSTSATTKKLLHLIELNGSLCVCSLEKMLQIDENNSISCKVHLHILKDCVNQVWIKENTFDLLSSDLLHPCLYNTNTTRVMSFSGWVFLYWFNGKYIQYYVLDMKDLKVVDLSLNLDFSTGLMGNLFRLPKFNLRNMVYQLNSHRENLISLQTFLPEGVYRSVNKRESDEAWREMLKHGAGLVYARKNSSSLHFFTLFTPIAFLSHHKSNQPPQEGEGSSGGAKKSNRKKKPGGRGKASRNNQFNDDDDGNGNGNGFDIRVLFPVLERLESVLRLIYLNRFPDSFKSLIQTIAEIPITALEFYENSRVIIDYRIFVSGYSVGF